MDGLVLKAYHCLPGIVRSVAASLHGYRLRSWRYGPETDALAMEALERERWGPDEWKAWQQERLSRLLYRAAKQVPYYREYWLRMKRQGERRSPEDLANWPVLSKETVRQHPEAFVADDCNTRAMYSEHTSGTTGTPLYLWLSRDTIRQSYSLFEARTRLWHGVSRTDRWGLLGGQPVVSLKRRSPPFWVWNTALNQLYLSAMHIAPWSAPSYLEAICRYRLKYLVGYSSSLHMLALTARRLGRKIPLKAVITNGEPLFGYQRQVIEEAFQCQAQQTYGMAEIVCWASECHSGRLHLWPEVGLVEVLDDSDIAVRDGAIGRIVATGLLNTDMPLVRYDTRDRGQLASSNAHCACSRGLPVLERVWGRSDDVVVTTDGRSIVQIDRIFGPDIHVQEGQIIQDRIGAFRIRVVPSAEWEDSDAATLRQSLSELVGAADIRVELTDRIERTWAGKFRVIVSNVSSEGSGLPVV